MLQSTTDHHLVYIHVVGYNGQGGDTPGPRYSGQGCGALVFQITPIDFFQIFSTFCHRQYRPYLFPVVGELGDQDFVSYEELRSGVM